MLRREVLLAATLLALPRVARADLHDEDVARWLAGTAAPAYVPPSGEWLRYARREDECWEQAAPRLRAMEEWSRRELCPLLPRDRPLLYPFAGPDALHPLALFRDTRHMLLIGLEPVGELPDPSQPPRPGYFEQLGAAMAPVHSLTFFRTRELTPSMKSEGVLPPLLAMLARMGGRVSGVSLTRPNETKVSVDWISEGGEARRLDYLQLDLSNAGLSARKDAVASLRGLAPYVTFLKAASYLLGQSRFSYVKKLLLEDSEVLVQDDSGIPFSDLDARWAKRLFGRYVPPDAPFQDRLQPDLEAAFARRAPAPLPFGIGYHVYAGSSNLLVASKVSS